MLCTKVCISSNGVGFYGRQSKTAGPISFAGKHSPQYFRGVFFEQ
jgi:hypothetical protein